MRTNVLTAFAAFLVVSSSSFAQSSKPAAKQTPAQEFAHAKELIENNCIDCEGGTQAGMEKGIKEMKEAIAAGYLDKVAAYKLLDDAYGSMQTYTDKNPNESAAYTAERAQSMNMLYKLAPDDAEVLERYADYVKDDSEKAKVLRRVVELDPMRADAWYLLGLLTAKSNVMEGMRLVEEAIERQQDPEAQVTYVGGLLDIMDAHACGLPNAAAWRNKIQSAYDHAVDGAGDPRAMPEFKKQFLAAVRQQHCANTATK